jgi:hypothetical protein
MKALISLLLITAPLAAIFLNPDGSRALRIDELEGITVESMDDVQRALTIENFNNLKDSDLASLILKTPRLATPGDVTAVGLEPKNPHLQGRTPNIKYVPSDTVPVTRVEIKKPSVVLDSTPIESSVDSTIIKQPEFYNSPLTLKSPTLDLPNFILKDSGEICLPEVEPLKLPQLTQPGEIHAELPKVNLARIDANMPEINLQSQQIDLPSVTVQEINTELPDVNVSGIEHEAFPDINVPNVDAELPDIVLPSAQRIDMPQVNLPQMDHSMPDVNIPVQAQLDLPEINLAKIDSELPQIDVDVAAHADLPSLDLPKFETSVPTFEIKSKQAEKINVEVPRVPIPQLKIKAAPQIKGVDVGAFIPSVVTLDGAEGYADITTLGQKAVAFPKLEGVAPGAPALPDLLMKGASATISPQIPMPDLSIRVPKIEAPAANLGKLIIQKQMIPIPSVKFPLPKINFHQVEIPRMPKFKACIFDCPDLVVPIPELHESVVNLVDQKVVEKPVVVPKKMVLSYLLVPETKYNQMKMKAKPMKKIIKKNLIKKKLIAHDLQKYWDKHDLPNEVARAYGIYGKKKVQDVEVLKGDYVGTSLNGN